MNLTCRCGGTFRPKIEKLGVMLAGGAAVAATGFLLGTPTGWLALLAAGSSREARQLIQLKLKVLYASKEAGTYLCCHACGRDVALSEILGDMPPAQPG